MSDIMETTRTFAEGPDNLWPSFDIDHLDPPIDTGPGVLSKPTPSNIQPILATGNPYIDGLIYGRYYIASNFTYSFPASASVYGANYSSNYNEPGIGFRQVSSSQIGAAEWILSGTSGHADIIQRYGAISSFTNLTFTEVNGDADLRFGATGSAQVRTALAYLPQNSNAAGDTWFGKFYDGTSADYRDVKVGNYAYATLIHEIGHTLGLKHAQEAGGPANVAVPFDKNDVEFSVMSYLSYIGSKEKGYTNEQYGFAQSYMMLDINALQTMYGANFGYNSSQTNYKWDPATGELFINGVGQGAPGAGFGGTSNRVFLTIWDGNGEDTYDFSNFNSSIDVNLAPGGWSKISSPQLAYLGGGNYARGNVYNALQFNGDNRSLIENAIGTFVDDKILGNSTNNSITGSGGNDVIDGSAGYDTAVYKGISKEYLFEQSGSSYIVRDSVSGRDGVDTLLNVEVARFLDGQFTLDSLVKGEPDHKETLHAVYRFFDAGTTGEHFYTTNAEEKNIIIAQLPSYRYESVQWAAPEKSADTVDVYRFLDTIKHTHLFTSDPVERDIISKTLPGLVYEGVAFQAYAKASATPGHLSLERFYDPTRGDHHLALPDEAEGMRRGAAGPHWIDEGPGLTVHVVDDSVLIA